ncbi:hypothetical protein D3C74_131560 [compost metagenome]
MEKFTLSRPIKDGDKVITEVEYDLESLNFKHLADINKQFVRIVGSEQAAQTMVKAMDETYQMLVLSKASNTPFEVISELSLKDSVRLGLRVQSFLFGSESENEKV